jgi:CubicO group peptidase (beta-lactamase class C family)
VLQRALVQRAFPGAVVAAGRRGEATRALAGGRLTYAPDADAVTARTLYDLASLTKVLATTTVAMRLHDCGRLDLEQPACEWLPGLRNGAKARITVAHLLEHSSGIPGWQPLFRQISGWSAYVERIEQLELTHVPGAQAEYSDLGFILLGALLERVAGEPWERVVREQVLAPMAMSETVYCPEPAWLPRVAPTEACVWRGRLLHGEVHDENAFAMGGVAPHAGLFGTAADVARVAHLMLDEGVIDGRRLVRCETVARFTQRAGVPASTRALGWDTRSDTGYSTAGAGMSRRAFGHTGFTGTSLWIDPERGAFVILLSNRVHPTRDNDGIRWVRPAMADAVLSDLDLA